MAVLIIFFVILQTVINAIMLSIEGQAGGIVGPQLGRGHSSARDIEYLSIA